MLLILPVVPCLTETGITVPKQLFPQTAREQLKGTQARHRHKNRQLIISSCEADCRQATVTHLSNMRWVLRFLSPFFKLLLHAFALGEIVNDANAICWIYGCKALGGKGVFDEEHICHIKSSRIWNNSPRLTGKHRLQSPPSFLYLGQPGWVKPSKSTPCFCNFLF